MRLLARIDRAWRENLRPAHEPPDLDEPVLQGALLRFSMAVLVPLAALAIFVDGLGLGALLLGGSALLFFRVFQLADTKAALRGSVLSKLPSNAIKFSPPGSRLELRARRQGPRTCIAVRDRGPGLSPVARVSLEAA